MTSTTRARRRPGLGTALGLVAILIASSGTAYAAGVMITSSAQIKDGVVTGADVKNKSITSQDLKVEAWHVVGKAGQPGFETGWSGFEEYYAPAFRKGADGRVYLRGAVTFGSDSGDPGYIFNLPTAYRPAACVLFDVASFDGLGGQDPQGAIEICPDGNVYPYSETDDRFISLEGIAFDLK